jgi:pimeloyl-ACP methyl ester carboxylesterase
MQHGGARPRSDGRGAQETRMPDARTEGQATEPGYHSVFVHAPDGIRIHARDYGERASERLPVVCLAGLSRNARDFHALAESLSQHRHRPRRVVAIDYRGRGRSDWDPNWQNYDVRIETTDILAVLDALGVAEAVFVGTSRGGLCTMALSAMRPGALRGAVLNDVGPVLEATGLLRIRQTVGKLPPPRSLEEAADMLRRTSDARFPALSDEDWLALAAGSWRTPIAGAKPGAPLEPSFDPAIMRPLADLDLEAPLPPLWPLFDALAHVPVLAIRGESGMMPQEPELRARFPHLKMSVHTVPGTGHHAHLDAPSEVAKLVADAWKS